MIGLRTLSTLSYKGVFSQLPKTSNLLIYLLRPLTMSLPQFWKAVQNGCKELSEKATKILIPFAAFYFCETGF
jgi:hypothetical protein